MRLIAFVISAMLAGVGGGLYAQFLGILAVDVFFLGLTFVTLSMLVIGSMQSLTGAVVGVVAVTLLIEILRFLERGMAIGGGQFSLPSGSQEIGLGIAMALVLILRPKGIANAKEIRFSRGD